MQNIKGIVAKYLNEFTREETRQRHLGDFLKNTSPESRQTDKSNMVGHVTVSGIIINKSHTKVLMQFHEALRRWLQPGGHVDPADETLEKAALREVREEVGIPEADLETISPLLDRSVPLDIDSHPIPENRAKQQGEHFHHDFRYLFRYQKEDEDISLEGAEATAYKWVSLAELDTQTTYRPLVEKLWHLLSVEFRTKEFYHGLITDEAWRFPAAKAVVVAHMIPDCLYFLRAINQLFPIISIVPKPNSIDAGFYPRVTREFDCTAASRTTINQPGNDLLVKLEATEGNLILFDIGGYFSEIDRNWPPAVKQRVVMVVEDTENGHQKYAARPDFPICIISAARSPLKDNEDFLVGQSVLFSADALMRTGGALIQYMKCGVFGYGKIGKSIAFHLQQRDVRPSVFDINPIRRIEAHNRLCSIPEREEILKTSDVIFCATGGQSLEITDFRNLKHGCMVFSVTSSDDEFDLTHLKGEYASQEVKPYIHKFWNAKNFFFLVNNGNAVNFIHNAVMGPFIHLVRAEMIVATSQQGAGLVQESGSPVHQVTDPTRQRIAAQWIRKFDPEHRQISSMEYIM
jgi:adenosylhomocysteinase